MDGSIKISKGSKTHHIIISPDGTAKYDFMTSLQNITIAKIISGLWMNVETLKEITVTFPIVDYYGGKREWERIENNIVAKISRLHVPNILFQKMKGIVKHLGQSILNWIRYHNEYIFCRKDSKYSALDLMNNIVWTSRGQIHYEQTSKSIFSNQYTFLDDKTKCVLACNYCLEDEIKLLAPKILEMFDYKNGASDPMVYFWTVHITGELNWQNNNSNRRHNNMSFNEYIMQQLLNVEREYHVVQREWNDVPIRFMWNKLSEEEKERNVTFLYHNTENKDCLFSLLSNLSYNLQQKFFKERYTDLLESIFNDWLWGEYFLPTTFIILESLEFCKPLDYGSVLTDILYRLCLYSKDVEKCMRDEYKSVFKRLWRETSIECKDYIIQYNDINPIEFFLATTLCWERDTDIAEAILEDLTAVQKKNIAFGEYGVYCCVKFIKNDRWDLLDSFLKHTLSTEEEIGRMKKKLVTKNNESDEIERFKNYAFETDDERENYYFNIANFTK